LGEDDFHAPQPVFWRTDGSIAHHDALFYFYGYDKDNPRISEARKYRERTAAIEVSDVAEEAAEKSAADWTADMKAAALGFDIDLVGVCAYRPEWTYQDRPQPSGKWAIVLGFGQDYDQMNTAPHEDAYIEVMAQYARAGGAAKHLANWIRDQGFDATAKTGPNTEDVLMIPAAIEAGLGELGKHGSMINKKLGSNFRLSMVMTDMPLEPDKPEVFGADQFCLNCQVCMNACPPDAIHAERQMLNGVSKWYVDFDKCLPYFIENKTCGLCLAICPWSRPGIADKLTIKMARRMARAD
jgi:ferredoxin